MKVRRVLILPEKNASFASMPIEAMIDQTFRNISCSDHACLTYLEIFTYALNRCVQTAKKHQEKEC